MSACAGKIDTQLVYLLSKPPSPRRSLTLNYSSSARVRRLLSSGSCAHLLVHSKSRGVRITADITCKYQAHTRYWYLVRTWYVFFSGGIFDPLVTDGHTCTAPSMVILVHQVLYVRAPRDKGIA